jgi:hypothetical protein
MTNDPCTANTVIAPGETPSSRRAKHPSAQPFSFRAVVSLMLLGMAGSLAMSGAVLFFSPRGQVANWTNWRFWGLSREQWSDLHLNTAALSVVLTLLHLWLNWRLLLSYLRRGGLWAIHRKYELGLAGLVVAGVIYGTFADWRPFAIVPGWRQSLRNSWESRLSRPPVPHLEEWSLDQLATASGVEITQLQQAAQALGWGEVSGQTTLAELGRRVGLPPQEVFSKLREQIPGLERVLIPGRGRGRGVGGAVSAEEHPPGSGEGRGWRGGRAGGLGRGGFGRGRFEGATFPEASSEKEN